MLYCNAQGELIEDSFIGKHFRRGENITYLNIQIKKVKLSLYDDIRQVPNVKWNYAIKA